MSDHYNLRKLREHVSLDQEWAAVGAAHVDLRKREIAVSSREERVLIRECEATRQECRARAMENTAKRLREKALALWCSGVVLWVVFLLSAGWWLVQVTQVNAQFERSGISQYGTRVAPANDVLIPLTQRGTRPTTNAR